MSGDWTLQTKSDTGAGYHPNADLSSAMIDGPTRSLFGSLEQSYRQLPVADGALEALYVLTWRFSPEAGAWLTVLQGSGGRYGNAGATQFALAPAGWTMADCVTRALADVEVGGWQGDITRSQFNDLIAPLVKRTLMACRRALKDAGVEAQEVLEVVMVGGSTRVPLVRERVGEFFGRTPLTSIDPDKVVAIGAAIQADILVGNKPDSELLLLDVIPLSLGLETMGGLVEKVIPRNTTIPVARAQEFTTFKDGQTAMSIHVMQGERELVQDCRSLARFALRGIPALPAGGAHIRVTFQVDADGLLSVTAMEKSTGVESSIQVKPSYGLTDGEIASMIQDSMSYAEQDVKARMLAEQKVEAARVLESLNGALAADAALLSAAERQVIDDAAAHLSAVAEGNDADAIEEAIKNVDKQTQDFAARRMDKSVRVALKGQSVDEV